tara:strand:+ start:347 stop:586 length:240 start_codon:yes stop_codon:yes gene_type:complete
MSKLTKKELEELVKQEQDKKAILHDIGLLHTQVHTLSHMFANISKEQEDASKVLEEKYGKINIDLTDGSFKVIKDEEDK